LEGLREIKAPLYGVPGNHDYWSGADFARIAQVFTATGGAWLPDQAVKTAARAVQVLGYTCRQPNCLQPEPGGKRVALIHYPAWFPNLGPHRFDAILAGHSHGGQVRLPFVGALVKPFGVEGYELGLYRTPAGPLYVGAGIGWFYLPVRFRCRPEITLIEL
jgi:predicted MPP superfamily phosphohydrolase